MNTEKLNEVQDLISHLSESLTRFNKYCIKRKHYHISEAISTAYKLLSVFSLDEQLEVDGWNKDTTKEILMDLKRKRDEYETGLEEMYEMY